MITTKTTKTTTRRYYAFGFADGTNTTTGEGRDLHIAGRLVAFASRQDRDAWVADGYAHRVPSDWGEFRRAVTVSSLPMGWVTRDAVDSADLAILG